MTLSSVWEESERERRVRDGITESAAKRPVTHEKHLHNTSLTADVHSASLV